MRRFRRQISQAIFGLSLSIISIVGTAGGLAAAEITIAPKSIAFPSSIDPSQKQKVFVSAGSDETLELSAVLIHSIIGPSGVEMSNTAVTSTYENSPTSLATISLSLKPSDFQYPGTYQIAIRIRGDHKTKTETTGFDKMMGLVLVRPELNLNLSIEKDRLFILERSFPWKDAQASTHFLISAENQVRVDAVSVKATDVSHQITASGSTSAVSDTQGRITPSSPISLTENLGSGILQFSSFDRSGDFRSALFFSGAGLAKPVKVPIQIQVKDSWYFPMFVIFLGVMLGSVVDWIVRRWRPEQMIRIRLAELRHRVEVFATIVDTHQNTQTIRNLLNQIWKLENNVEILNVTDADITALDLAINDLQAVLVETQNKANLAHETLERDINTAKRSLTQFLEPDDFDDIEVATRRSNQLLIVGRSDAALKEIQQTDLLLRDVQKTVVERTLTKLATLLENIQEETIKVQFTSRLKALSDSLVQTMSIADIGQKLISLEQDLINVQSPSPLRAHASSPKSLTQEPVTILMLPENSAQHRVNEPVTFAISGTIPDIKTITWNFGSGGVPGDGASNSLVRTFITPGFYSARAEIELVGGGVCSVGPIAFMIKASENQNKLAAAARRIRGSDSIIILFSLIAATGVGFIANYSDKPFGSFEDYLIAFLWGFGIEKTVRGFSATFNVLNTGK